MNDNGFLYNLERAQAGPVDEEALARKMAARTARVARAHESVFTAVSYTHLTLPTNSRV